MGSYVEFDGVKKTYRMGDYDIEALAGVSFGIEEGQFVIIAGASGAGKSTILNILGGMDLPTSGKTYLDGPEVSAYAQKPKGEYRRSAVGFGLQIHLFISTKMVRCLMGNGQNKVGVQLQGFFEIRQHLFFLIGPGVAKGAEGVVFRAGAI